METREYRLDHDQLIDVMDCIDSLTEKSRALKVTDTGRYIEYHIYRESQGKRGYLVQLLLDLRKERVVVTAITSQICGEIKTDLENVLKAPLYTERITRHEESSSEIESQNNNDKMKD